MSRHNRLLIQVVLFIAFMTLFYLILNGNVLSATEASDVFHLVECC